MATRARADDDAIKAKDRLNRESARASTSRGATETIEYGTFHARVGAVFGDGDGGGWRPRSNAVTRRGGDGDGGDGEDASESASERCGDDLDCLESDEEGDDDARKMTRLAASVGRCRALDGEADFDEDDALALGVDARERRSMNGVTSMVERARAVGAPSAVDRVPDHVANPAKYTRYALDEELAPFVVGTSRALAAVDVEIPATSADAGLEPRRLLQQEPELPRVDRVGAAARRPPFPAQRGPRVNADFSSTRAALGMARVRHKTRSPVAI